MTSTPPEPPDPWGAPVPGSQGWESPRPPVPPPGYGSPGYGGPGAPPMPPPGWPQQPPPGTGWDAPGYGNWMPQRNNGLGTTSLVLGIIALLAIVTVIGGFVLGIVALIFGLMGRGRVKRREADNGGAATAGIVLGSLAAVASAAIFLVFIVLAVDQIQDCVDSGIPREQCEVRFSSED